MRPSPTGLGDNRRLPDEAWASVTGKMPAEGKTNDRGAVEDASSAVRRTEAVRRGLEEASRRDGLRQKAVSHRCGEGFLGDLGIAAVAPHQDSAARRADVPAWFSHSPQDSHFERRSQADFD